MNIWKERIRNAIEYIEQNLANKIIVKDIAEKACASEYHLQDTNTKMWKEWLLNCREYKLGGEYNVEMYTPFCEDDPQSGYCELWLPLEKA